MRVAIAGAGNVGRSIARELIANDHVVLLIDRDPTAIKPDSVPGADGNLTRVRVGPVINRAEAEALKAKLEQAGKPGGMIRPHP